MLLFFKDFLKASKCKTFKGYIYPVVAFFYLLDQAEEQTI